MNRLSIALLGALCAAAVLSISASCKTASGDGQAAWPTFRYQSCSQETPCPAGFDCSSSRCISDDGRFVMTTASCESRDDCGYGMACVESACVVDILDCQSDFDCVGNQVCVEGACVEKSSCTGRGDQPCYEFEHWHD